jgi:hypothetical protein
MLDAINQVYVTRAQKRAKRDPKGIRRARRFQSAHLSSRGPRLMNGTWLLPDFMADCGAALGDRAANQIQSKENYRD